MHLRMTQRSGCYGTRRTTGLGALPDDYLRCADDWVVGLRVVQLVQISLKAY